MEPAAPVKDWSLLAREMSLNKIPGLVLDSCTDADLKSLADLRDLRRLILYDTSITDAGLEHLKALTGLETLVLGRARITGAGLAHLKGLTGLRELMLSATRVTDAGLVHLEGFTGLRDLSLAGTRITDAGLVHLKGLTGLRHLDLRNTPVTYAGLEHLQGLTQLRSLDLYATRVAGQGIIRLQSLTGLEYLRLGGDRITDGDLAPLDGLRGLRTLELSGSSISDTGLTYIRNLTALRTLNLRDANHGCRPGSPQGSDRAGAVGIGEHSDHRRWPGTSPGLQGVAAAMARPHAARRRRSRAPQRADRSAAVEPGGHSHHRRRPVHLRGLAGLQRLWLDDTQVGDAGLGHLKGLTELVMLELPGTQVSDAGLAHLRGLTKLQGLYLGRTRITDAGLKHLQGLTELRDLGLTETQVTDAGARQLKQSLPRLVVWTTQAQPATQGTGKPGGPVRADATPVFTDSFDNGPSEKWRFTDSRTGSPAPGHAVENKQLRLSHARAFLDSIDLSDYVVRAHVCFKEWVPNRLNHGSFGISVRQTPSLSGASNRQDLYNLSLLCSDQGGLWMAFSYRDAAGGLRHAVLGYTPCKVVVGQWYTLEFEVRGEQLRAYLDGKLMLEAADERLTKGSIQINVQNATVLMDDFSIYALP